MAEENKEYMPRLRFPEFHRTESWIQTPLIDVASLKTGYAFKSQNYVSNGKYKIVTISNVKSGYFDKENMNTINELPSDIQEHQILNRGDILISMTGNVGRVCRVDAEQCLLNQRVGKIIPFGINNIFIYHIFQTDIFIDTMKIKAIGGAQGNLSVSSIQEHKIYYPRKEEEQQKIADCLSSLDELIEAHEQKRDALVEHKKGLMQRLFPAEGETTPRWRFPEFRKGGEWKKEKLGKLTSIVSSKRVHQSDWRTKGIPFYRARDIVALFKKEYFEPLYIDEELYTSYINKYGNIDKNDLLVTGVGTIGVPYLVTNNKKFYFKDGNIIMIKNCKSLDGLFLFYTYQSKYVQKQIESMACVGTVGTYTIENAKSTCASFPPIPEQQKIADCLSSLDARIEAEEAKIAALREHKQGLMQQLFPQSL